MLWKKENIDNLYNAIDSCIGGNLDTEKNKVSGYDMSLGEISGLNQEMPTFMNPRKGIGIFEIGNGVTGVMIEAGAFFAKGKFIFNINGKNGNHFFHPDYICFDSRKIEFIIKSFIDSNEDISDLFHIHKGKELGNTKEILAKVEAGIKQNKNLFFISKRESESLREDTLILPGNKMSVPKNLKEKSYYFFFLDDKGYFIFNIKGEKSRKAFVNSTHKIKNASSEKGIMNLVKEQLSILVRSGIIKNTSSPEKEASLIINKSIAGKGIGSFYKLLSKDIIRKPLSDIYKEEFKEMIIPKNISNGVINKVIDLLIDRGITLSSIKNIPEDKKSVFFTAYKSSLEKVVNESEKAGIESYLTKQFEDLENSDNKNVIVKIMSLTISIFYLEMSDLRDYQGRFIGVKNKLNSKIVDCDIITARLLGLKNKYSSLNTNTTLKIVDIIVGVFIKQLESIHTIKKDVEYQKHFNTKYLIPERDIVASIQKNNVLNKLKSIPVIHGIIDILTPFIKKIGLLNDTKDLFGIGGGEK